ncbi:hypothetical protein [Candidatus Regiella insecticola]|nr:hypothetical protein [Candidatus Regiella insecticola]
MSVDILADGTNARSQQRGDCKGRAGFHFADILSKNKLTAKIG